MVRSVAAVADPEQQLAWERRQRLPAGIAAIVAAVFTLGGELWSQSIFRDVPKAGFLESLQNALRSGPVGRAPSVRTAFFEFYDDHAATILASSVVRGIGLIGLGWAVTFLAAATRGRRPELPKPVVYVPLVGALLSAISTVLGSVGSGIAVSNFLDGPRTVDDAADVGSSSLLVTAQFVGLAGQLALATGLVLISLNAMRAGLLTRFLGILGIITGALVIIPLGPVPVVQAFWLGALGLVILGRTPGGVPPAWQTGKAEPWPSQRDVAEKRRAGRGQAPAPAEEEQPEPVAAGRQHPASRKRKRKRRA
jgi:hypothetical protein